MHYQTLLLGALLGTTTTVFAKAPYVQSFYNKDCTGHDAGDRASFSSDGCAAFDSKYDAVQVNFGTNLGQIDSVTVFSDDKCTKALGKVTSSRADDTPAVCTGQLGHWGKWGSVRKTLPGE